MSGFFFGININMANAFSNFLGGVVNGVFGKGPITKDYQHADRVYVKNNYARAPKFGFLYFINFNINTAALPRSNIWGNIGYKEVGLLVKRADLPKFSISTETLNQYNRKTIIQTALKYDPITIDFHDDNSNITRDLWKSYFQYYYMDSTYGKDKDFPIEFKNTKYSVENYSYGLNSFQSTPFFSSIDIYVLHQHKFTHYVLINPIVTNWSHDTLDQSDSSKILTNKVTVAFETVLYKEGSITQSSPAGFASTYYDTAPSPLSIAGNGTNTLLGPGGIINGVDQILNGEGSLLQKAILGANVLRNAKTLSVAGIKQEGYSIVSGVLGNIQQTGNQPGGVSSSIQTGISQRGTLNIFGNQSASEITQSTPSRLTGK